MACNCNKCNPNKCGCSDPAITNPCTYTDCSVGSERCSEVSCTECISYCGTTFQIGTSGSLLKIETGERLDLIIQKMALMMSQGIGGCTSDDLHHAPYNLYAANVTNNGAMILWNGESTLTTQIEVFVDPGAGYVSAGVVSPTVLQLALTGLVGATDYKVKLQSTDGAVTCDSVEILFTTLL
tara:strand:- start:376 stop:921 length:546 start_codon:yes stop_codon:yes gene_type:complete